MNKPRPARPLADAARTVLAESFAKQGFAVSELVTRWAEIAGLDIAAHTEPIKMRWPRTAKGEAGGPATLVLRVEGPAALEIQHMSGVIVERVNRFFGWQAVGQIALRQAPLTRRAPPRPRDDHAEAAAQIAATLTDIKDEKLRTALARLGAAVKRR
ncbi:MAG TPA: DciA family protein [Xanthobacteraceae bacterium]|nr:DciA family protein [Xanthobacteraceae bacterium]